MVRPAPKAQLFSQIPQRVAEPEQVAPLLYNLQDTGRLLACSRSTVSKLITTGELSAIGLGRMRRVRHDSIMAYIERNQLETP